MIHNQGHPDRSASSQRASAQKPKAEKKLGGPPKSLRNYGRTSLPDAAKVYGGPEQQSEGKPNLNEAARLILSFGAPLPDIQQMAPVKMSDTLKAKVIEQFLKDYDVEKQEKNAATIRQLRAEIGEKIDEIMESNFGLLRADVDAINNGDNSKTLFESVRAALVERGAADRLDSYV